MSNLEFNADSYPRVFIDIDTIHLLKDYEADESGFPTDMRLEIPTVNFTAVADSDEDVFRVFVRDQMEGDITQVCEASFDDDGDISLDMSDRVGGEGIDSFIKLLIATYFRLLAFFDEDGLPDEIDDLWEIDFETDGVLVYDDGGEPTARIVSGPNRPNLLCQTLFGGSEMSRPYSDEVMSHISSEVSDFDPEADEKRAEEGDVYAMSRAADAYMNGKGCEVDFARSLHWYEKAAENGDAKAMFNTALMYMKGCGTEMNLDRAVEWFGKAADESDEDAEGLLEEVKQAADDLKKADAGDAEAQARMSEFFMKLAVALEQSGTEFYYSKSVEYAEKAAAQGNAEAMYALALAYQHGRGVDEDYDKAIDYYKRASDMGHAPSQWNLACEYNDGTHIERDLEKTAELALKSCAGGYELALELIGKMFQAFDEQFEWQYSSKETFEQFAEEHPNCPNLEYAIGISYTASDEDGEILDIDKAIYWFNKAVENGGDEMALGQYRMFYAIRRLKQENLIPEGEFDLQYVMSRGIVEVGPQTQTNEEFLATLDRFIADPDSFEVVRTPLDDMDDDFLASLGLQCDSEEFFDEPPVTVYINSDLAGAVSTADPDEVGFAFDLPIRVEFTDVSSFFCYKREDGENYLSEYNRSRDPEECICYENVSADDNGRFSCGENANPETLSMFFMLYYGIREILRDNSVTGGDTVLITVENGEPELSYLSEDEIPELTYDDLEDDLEDDDDE